TDDLIVEDLWEVTGELPGLEERRPVDALDEVGKRVVEERAYALEAWARRPYREIEFHLIRTGGLDRHAGLTHLVAGAALPNLLVLILYLLPVALRLRLRED